MLFAKFAVVIAATLAVSRGHSLRQYEKEFEKFERDYGKSYKDADERMLRFTTFVSNLKAYDEHNKLGHSWTKSVSQFSDLTDEEFRKLHLNGYVNSAKPKTSFKSRRSRANIENLPKSVDWREKGAITEVKNQGSCGSCWAFATVQSIESYVQINNGSLMELSAQQITSCTPNPMTCGGSGGCQGSIPQLGFAYVEFFGLVTEEEYGYTSGMLGLTGKCKADVSASVATLRGYETLVRNSYEDIMDHLANVGPLSVAVDASAWSSYRGGVFDGCDFNKNIQINHAVQLVGYGSDDKDGDYWIVRNSWGKRWGEDGYIRLQRKSTPQCGTDNTPLYGTGCVDDGVEIQHVCGQCGILFDVAYPIGATEKRAN